jgi:hypothetical protein
MKRTLMRKTLMVVSLLILPEFAIHGMKKKQDPAPHAKTFTFYAHKMGLPQHLQSLSKFRNETAVNY